MLSGLVLSRASGSPEWKTKKSPLKTQATDDKFLYLTETKSYQLPTPPQMHNNGNYIISLSDFTKWLAQQAEELEVEIYPGFSASEVLFDENNKVYNNLFNEISKLNFGSIVDVSNQWICVNIKLSLIHI